MRRSLVPLVVVAIGAMLGAVGCAPSAEPPTTSKPTATSTPTETPTVTPAPTEALWERFSDERMDYSFETPPGWTVEELPTSYTSEGIVQLAILDPAGARQLYFSSGVTGLGGACGTTPPIVIEELDDVSVDIPGYAPMADPLTPLGPPRITFRAFESEQGVIASLALTDEQPVESCFFFNLLHPGAGMMVFADALQVSADAPPRTFASMDEARAFVETEEYATLHRILSSLRIAG